MDYIPGNIDMWALCGLYPGNVGSMGMDMGNLCGSRMPMLDDNMGPSPMWAK